MSNFTLFVCGLAITLISGMGVAISQVNMGYEKIKRTKKTSEEQLYFDVLKEESL